MIHKGFLHRDIGTADLYRLQTPTKMRPFVPGNFGQILGEPQVWKDDQVLQDQVERLRTAIADLGIEDTCCGVIQPTDMTVDMKDYYSSGGVAHQPVSTSVRASTPLLEHSTGLLRVHVFWAFEVDPVLGAISSFSGRRPRVLLLHHAMGGGLQQRF